MSPNCTTIERILLIPAKYNRESRTISTACPDCKTVMNMQNRIYAATKHPVDIRIQVTCPKCSAINIAGVVIDHVPKGIIH